jgi:hypothetical protein
MHVFDLLKIRQLKISAATSLAVTRLLKDELAGFWIHLDADVLNDKIMTAVDYRLDGGGLNFSELSELLRSPYGSRWFYCKEFRFKYISRSAKYKTILMAEIVEEMMIAW